MTPFIGTNRITSRKMKSRTVTVNGKTNTAPHNGKDSVPSRYAGEPIAESRWRTRALTGGTVLEVSSNSMRGKYVKVQFSPGCWWLFQHMASISVKKGDAIKAGQFIGVAGNTGSSTNRHLHHEVWMNGGYVDPDILDGLPNKEGLYEQNNIIYGESQEDDMTKFKIFAPTGKVVSSQQVTEGVIGFKGADGKLYGYVTSGDARMVREYTEATKSAVFEAMKGEMQENELILSVEE